LVERATSRERLVPQVPRAARAAREAGSSLFGWLANTYREELKTLKALGIGVAAGVVRDMITQALPPDLEPQVSEWVDNVTSKAGGRPIHWPILAKITGDGNGRSHTDPMEDGRF